MSSASSESDPILVSYHDSIVRLSNLRTLDDSNWLDDNIITFAFEYLQYESEYTKNNDNLYAFVTPPVVQLVKMSDDYFAEQVLQSIGFLDKRFLILPINNNTQVTVFGGSHWSLLILSIQGIINKKKSFLFRKYSIILFQIKFYIILIQCHYQMIVQQEKCKENFELFFMMMLN